MFRVQQYGAMLAVWFAVLVVAAGDVPRPRGVPLSRASLYNPAKDFTCFDGTGTIPFGQVNDDYCDCFDGSDEPGTSACTNGAFHCTNAGHRPLNIPSSRVNDGVCDCCDGTDEYSRSGVSCTDTCEELGREARAEAQRRAELLKAGSQLRIELVEKGNAHRSEMAQQLTQLEKDKQDAERLKAEKEELKNELEAKENEALKVYREAEELARARKEEEERVENEREAREIFVKFDSDGDGKLTQTEIQTRTTFDKNRDGQIDDEEALYFLAEHDSVDVETFVSEAWSRVKPFLMIDQGMFKPQAEAEGYSPEGEEEHLDAREREEGEGEEAEPEEVESEDAGELPEEASRAYDERTQEIVDAATEARRQHTDAERAVREIDSNMRNIRESLEKDYGPQQEFATLDGLCLEYTDKEYVYKLCLFGKVTQQSKGGGGEIHLGGWGEWAGTEGERYRAMKYTNGVSCWNGPNRSTLVHVNCGLEDQLTAVSEPSRCEYLMELSTPAACDDTRQPQAHDHDEL